MIDVPSIKDAAEAIDTPPENWGGNCHGISLAIVHSGIMGEPGPTCRVVRGVASYAIGGQHSWVCLGTPYDPDAIYVDYTAHQWRGNDLTDVVVTTAKQGYKDHMDLSTQGGHVIHGYDPTSIWKFGRPRSGEGELLTLDASRLSESAQTFLKLLGPLDADGWQSLCRYPQGGWPYKEIVKAIVKQIPGTITYLPIDIYSQAADVNASNLYW